jgi:copper chaperone CopZ
MATPTNPTPVSVRIHGMSCGHCVKIIAEVLAPLPGITVRLVAIGGAILEAADSTARDTALAAIRDAGYEASVEKDSLIARGAQECRDGPECAEPTSPRPR